MDESFEHNMACTLEAMRKENRKLKRKAGIGFILVAALVLVIAAALAISIIHYLSRQDT